MEIFSRVFFVNAMSERLNLRKFRKRSQNGHRFEFPREDLHIYGREPLNRGNLSAGITHSPVFRILNSMNCIQGMHRNKTCHEKNQNSVRDDGGCPGDRHQPVILILRNGQ